MTESVNPFAAPKEDPNKGLPASNDKPSFASRVSVLLGLSGFVALVLFAVIATRITWLAKLGPSYRWLYQLLTYLMFVGPIVGFSVVFAAPKGKKLPGLLVNGAFLALMAIAWLVVLFQYTTERGR